MALFGSPLLAVAIIAALGLINDKPLQLKCSFSANVWLPILWQLLIALAAYEATHVL